MVGARLRRCRAAAAEGRRAAGPGTTHRQRKHRRLGPVALVRVVVRKVLRKEIFFKGKEGDFFGWWD